MNNYTVRDKNGVTHKVVYRDLPPGTVQIDPRPSNSPQANPISSSVSFQNIPTGALVTSMNPQPPKADLKLFGRIAGQEVYIFHKNQNIEIIPPKSIKSPGGMDQHHVDPNVPAFHRIKKSPSFVLSTTIAPPRSNPPPLQIINPSGGGMGIIRMPVLMNPTLANRSPAGVQLIPINPVPPTRAAGSVPSNMVGYHDGQPTPAEVRLPLSPNILPVAEDVILEDNPVESMDDLNGEGGELSGDHYFDPAIMDTSNGPDNGFGLIEETNETSMEDGETSAFDISYDILPEADLEPTTTKEDEVEGDLVEDCVGEEEQQQQQQSPVKEEVVEENFDRDEEEPLMEPKVEIHEEESPVESPESEPQVVDHEPDGIQSLEWHIERSRARMCNIPLPTGAFFDSGLISLEINNGRILGRENSAAGNLITVMNKMECKPSLEYDQKWIEGKRLEEWKPAVRNKRLQSDSAKAAASELARDLKRKSDSCPQLHVDGAGEYQRKKPKNLLCEETINEHSSEDLTDTERSENVDEPQVLMPSAVAEMDLANQLDLFADVKEEFPLLPLVSPPKRKPPAKRRTKAKVDHPQRLPVMSEGKQMFNSEPNTLQSKILMVRECFRPMALGPESNGFDFVHWQSNVGVLFGSNLNFFINDLGLMDLIKGGGDEDEEEENDRVDSRRDVPSYYEQQESPQKGSNARQQQNNTPTITQMKYEFHDDFWESYMEKRGSFAAPNYLFKHVQTKKPKFEHGMWLEVIDPESIGTMAQACVVETLGGRICVRISDQLHYFNENAWELFPVGSCEALRMSMPKTLILKRPKLKRFFDPELVKKLRAGEFLFQANHRLEAFDWHGNGQLRPATVRRVILNRLLIVFDEDQDSLNPEWVPRSSYWCADDSPLVHVIGHHKEMGLPFSAPENFHWYKYLKNRKATAAPGAAFRTRRSQPFRVGMQLEAVDRISPNLIRPATVMAVKDYEIQILYDGFPQEANNDYRMWVWDDSEDIYPVGWCRRNKHKLLVDKSGAEGLCKNRFCKDIGNTRSRKAYHSFQIACPYKMPDFFHVAQRDWRVAGRITKYAKLAMNQADEHVDLRDEIIALLEEKVRQQTKSLKGMQAVRDYGPRSGDVQRLWDSHAQLLPEGPSNPLSWNSHQVRNFVNSVPNCKFLGGVFLANDIDGEALLSLTEDDLNDVLSLKQGLAIKIYNSIVRLRSQAMAQINHKDEEQ